MENRKIASYSNYEVSSNGDVFTLNYCGKGLTKRLLPQKDRNGYLLVTMISDAGQRKTCQVHRLVALAFLGESNGLEVNHIDGNKSNNHVSNLEYCTRAENIKHSFRIGIRTAKNGEAHNSAKLKESDVLEIRKLHSLSVSQTEIARSFSLSIGQVCRIVNRKVWRHV